jgi:peptidoglycan hydrolase-like protein with peptidoglycan-binding domain
MAGIISMNLLASVISLSLMAPGSLTPSQVSGQDPVAVAGIQSSLDVLGMNAGPINGDLSRTTYQSAENFLTQFGQSPGESLLSHLQRIVSSLPALGPDVSGASVVAVQSWLLSWHLYSGPVNGRMTKLTDAAIRKFQSLVGLPATGQVNGPTLESIAHLAVVRQAYLRHWAYAAQAHDRMSEIAWATGVSLKRLEADNPAHGTVLWVGQIVRFRPPLSAQTASPASQKAVLPVGAGKKERTVSPVAGSVPSGHPLRKPHKNAAAKVLPTAAPAGSPPSQGIYSNLQPIAALILYDPNERGVTALLQAQEEYPHNLVDVAVTGEWVLNHPEQMQKLEHSGNEVIMDGYTGVSLNSLPAWGIRQEVQWSVKAFEETGVQTSAFISQPSPFSSPSDAALGSLNVLPMSPAETVGPIHWQNTLVDGLLQHPEGVMGSAFVPQSAAVWTNFFGALAPHHFIFLTLGQIWANGG